jgi:stage II sporulation SpoAA-like protein
MPMAMHRESGDTYRLDISGVLLRAEYGRCEAELKSELERVGSVKLLCLLHGFEGWEPDADWSDLSFYVKYGDAIRRIAIVGNERWRSEMLMFVAADLRAAPVEFFGDANLADARAWLAG